MDLLLLIDDGKSHYVYIKDFNRFMFHNAESKNKKRFCRSCLQCFSEKNVLIKHNEDYSSINGEQSVQLEEATIKFQNYFKQMPVPFKFVLILSVIQNLLKVMKAFTQKNINVTLLVVLLIKLFVLIIDLVNRLSFIEVKMLLVNLLEQFLKSISTLKK